MFLERFKEGIEVTHKQNDSTEKKNQNRQEAIQEHFEENFQLSKDIFQSFLKNKSLSADINQSTEQINKISFENANPRNNFFMNELFFAGEAITEGFLECFMIEKNTAIEKYQNQLQMIEKIEDGKSQYYVGTFKENKLLRATSYQDSKEALIDLLQSREDKRANNQKQKEEQQMSLSRRKED